MAGYYVRRGTAIAGPFDSAKLRELIDSGQALRSDEYGRSAEGPWILGSQAPKLFPSTAIVPTSQPDQPLAVVDEPPPTFIEEPVTAILRVTRIAGTRGGRVITVVARSTAVVGHKALSGVRLLVQQRHERKMAELAVRAAEAEARIKSQPERPAYSQPAPQIVQNTVVKVRQGGGGCSDGCAGCLLILLLPILYLLWSYGVFNTNSF